MKAEKNVYGEGLIECLHKMTKEEHIIIGAHFNGNMGGKVDGYMFWKVKADKREQF